MEECYLAIGIGGMEMQTSLIDVPLLWQKMLFHIFLSILSHCARYAAVDMVVSRAHKVLHSRVIRVGELLLEIVAFQGVNVSPNSDDPLIVVKDHQLLARMIDQLSGAHQFRSSSHVRQEIAEAVSDISGLSAKTLRAVELVVAVTVKVDRHIMRAEVGER